MEKPIIVTDVDGVLLNYCAGMLPFLLENGIRSDVVRKSAVDEIFRDPTELFGCRLDTANEIMDRYGRSVYGKCMPAYEDAMTAVMELSDHYDFIAVTMFGTDYEHWSNRNFNLNSMFPSAFKEVHSGVLGNSKSEFFQDILDRYGSRVKCYVDDRNCFLCDASIIFPTDVTLFKMLRGNNRNEVRFGSGWLGVKSVNNWYEIRDTMLNQLIP